MTLLCSVFAAIICTIMWYKNANHDELYLRKLSLIYWGASLMWFVDAIFEYIELGEDFFKPALSDMLNDFYLGLSIVALGLIIWLTILIIKDPKAIIKNALLKK